MINNVVIVGRLVEDPELKTTANGKSVCNFNIAYNTGWGDFKKSNFIRCTAWQAAADIIIKYYKKGDKIAVSGTLEQNRWETQDGQKKSIHQIIVRDMESCGKSSKNKGTEAPNNKESEANDAEEPGPSENEKEPEDDNIPF
jgi:single-strand DNA-binding protein